MKKFILRRGDVKTMKNFGKAHSAKRLCKNGENPMGMFNLRKRRCKNDENTMGKLNLSRSEVKRMKIL